MIPTLWLTCLFATCNLAPRSSSVRTLKQRARATVEERVPEQSQQATLRELGTDGVRELVERYVDAWERSDIEAFAAMLTRDATFAMPPLASWYRGRDAIRQWAIGWPLSGEWRWRALPTVATHLHCMFACERGAYSRATRQLVRAVPTFLATMRTNEAAHGCVASGRRTRAGIHSGRPGA